MSEDWRAKYLVEKQMRKDADDRATELEEKLEALRAEVASGKACPNLRVGEYGGDGLRWMHCALAEQPEDYLREAGE